MVSLFRRIGPAGVLALAALVFAMPAQARAAGCPRSRPTRRSFRGWIIAWYVPAPDGGLEGGAGEWTLTGGAAVADGNEPYLAGEQSLALPAGGSATTAPMCIGIEHPTMRLFARNTGLPPSLLAVSVVFRDLLGLQRSLPVGLVTAGLLVGPDPGDAGRREPALLLGDQRRLPLHAASTSGGEWTIDDVYVDPYKKG